MKKGVLIGVGIGTAVAMAGAVYYFRREIFSGALFGGELNDKQAIADYRAAMGNVERGFVNPYSNTVVFTAKRKVTIYDQNWKPVRFVEPSGYVGSSTLPVKSPQIGYIEGRDTGNNKIYFREDDVKQMEKK